MIINWFSPLPPAKTEIAAYTRRILPPLCEQVEVRLWTSEKTWDRSLQEYCEVCSFSPDSPPWERIGSADVSFYNLGNNGRFHDDIWAVSEQQPGVAIVHDPCLHDLVAFRYQGRRKDRESYLRLLRSVHGAEGVRLGAQFWDGLLPPAELAEKCPCTPALVATAIAALVHTDEARKAILAAGGPPTVFSPLPYGSVAPPPSRSVHPPPWRLLVFGHLGSNRCLDAILRALATSHYRDLFSLDICGELHDATAARGISEFGLESQVKLRGYLSEENLDSALLKADLAINLRYPTMGEVSASQLRIWSRALPSIVTRVGWYAEIPEGAALFVQPGDEISDLHGHLKALSEDPESLAVGKAGYDYLIKEHGTSRYIEQVLSLARDASQLRLRRAGLRCADRLGKVLGSCAEPHAAERYLDRCTQIVWDLVCQ